MKGDSWSLKVQIEEIFRKLLKNRRINSRKLDNCRRKIKRPRSKGDWTFGGRNK